MTAPQPLTAARRAEIRARHKDTRRILPGCECSVCLAPADIAALLAEVERLRAALRLIAAHGGKTLLGDGRYDEGAHAAFENMADIARAAIGEDSSHG